MIASLPLTAWLLLIATIVLPLSIELAYLVGHRRARRRRDEIPADRGGEGRTGR